MSRTVTGPAWPLKLNMRRSTSPEPEMCQWNSTRLEGSTEVATLGEISRPADAKITPSNLKLLRAAEGGNLWGVTWQLPHEGAETRAFRPNTPIYNTFSVTEYYTHRLAYILCDTAPDHAHSTGLYNREQQQYGKPPDNKKWEFITRINRRVCLQRGGNNIAITAFWSSAIANYHKSSMWK